jgi:hypothetical protein
VAIGCDDCLIAVLMKWTEYKKHKKLRSIGSEMQCNVLVLSLHFKNYIY